MTEFILDKSNAREKTIELLDKHCDNFEGWNPELMEFVRSEEILNEIMDAIDEGLDNLNTKVMFNLASSEFCVDVEVTVYNVIGSAYEKSVPNPEYSRLIKFYVYAQDFASDDDYTVCDDIYYRIDMFREG